MAPRRNPTSQTALDVHSLLGLDPDSLDSVQPNHQQSGNNNNMNHTGMDNYARCCVPIGDCFKACSVDFGLISMDDLRDCVRVICNNENCTAGQYMHRECFEQWEQGVLSYLKSIGRARSWSDRQRHQNLWTKKGYDLVFKACGCKCGRGHLKKDLDWVPPPMHSNIFGRMDEEATKKKKKRNRNNQKPILSITSNPIGFHPSSQMLGNGGNVGVSVNTSLIAPIELRTRTGSLSSSNGSSSPPASASSDHSISPVHNGVIKKQKSRVEAYSERVRTTSGCNGIFSRRLDFSTFNMLSKTRLNSYQIKVIVRKLSNQTFNIVFLTASHIKNGRRRKSRQRRDLSSLAQHQKSRVSCILCEEPMLVFDRYPLVDGTFFLSPKQHTKGCTEVKYDGHTQYLTAVCMGCLDGGSQDRIIRCRFCAQKWDGSSLVLGTMYAYDIFAAMPCCTERLKCNHCYKLLLYPHQRLNFFSDYSHVVSCVHCTTQDTHFVKPLAYCYTKQPLQVFQPWP